MEFAAECDVSFDEAPYVFDSPSKVEIGSVRQLIAIRIGRTGNTWYRWLRRINLKICQLMVQPANIRGQLQSILSSWLRIAPRESLGRNVVSNEQRSS